MSNGVLAQSSLRRARIRIYACVVPFSVLMLIWLLVVVEAGYEGQVLQRGPNGVFLGSDFAMFFGAAQVVKDSGNPYDHALLYRTEAAVLHRQGLPVLHESTLVRVGNPPLFLWALQPLTQLPFQTAASLWIGLMVALAAVGFLAALRALGWRRRLWPTLLFLAMPQVFESAFTGNVIPVVFAGTSLSLLLIRRYPFAAGALLGVAWLKPQVALPLGALIVLFQSRDRLRAALGATLATALVFGGSILVMGLRGMLFWLDGLAGYSRDMAPQGDLASLAGIYYRWAPADLRLAFGALSLAIAVGLTAFWWWRSRGRLPLPPLGVGWLWFVWFLATPYAHFYDQILLTIPVLALLGRDGANVSRPLHASVLYLMFLAVIPYNISLPRAQLLWVPVLLATICLVLATRDPIGSVRRHGPMVLPGSMPQAPLHQAG